ncbi:hypothetical protein DID75_03610 [Candidatus Marinamargulisbacteria bacterium SCGC AG-410-N11]|nr:hypothetical protein DID75_03610 [Candidatus Marinamargulisbacteria bacterium SCGC AG-410-N11]
MLKIIAIKSFDEESDYDYGSDYSLDYRYGAAYPDNIISFKESIVHQLAKKIAETGRLELLNEINETQYINEPDQDSDMSPIEYFVAYLNEDKLTKEDIKISLDTWVKKGVDINLKMNDLIILAIHNQRYKALAQLLDKGGDFNGIIDSCLVLETLFELNDCLELIIEYKDKINWNIKDSWGNNILFIALKSSCSHSLMEFLLNCCYKHNPDMLLETDFAGKTLFDNFILRNRFNLIKALENLDKALFKQFLAQYSFNGLACLTPEECSLLIDYFKKYDQSYNLESLQKIFSENLNNLKNIEYIIDQLSDTERQALFSNLNINSNQIIQISEALQTYMFLYKTIDETDFFWNTNWDIFNPSCQLLILLNQKFEVDILSEKFNNLDKIVSSKQVNNCLAAISFTSDQEKVKTEESLNSKVNLLQRKLMDNSRQRRKYFKLKSDVCTQLMPSAETNNQGLEHAIQYILNPLSDIRTRGDLLKEIKFLTEIKNEKKSLQVICDQRVDGIKFDIITIQEAKQWIPTDQVIRVINAISSNNIDEAITKIKRCIKIRQIIKDVESEPSLRTQLSVIRSPQCSISYSPCTELSINEYVLLVTDSYIGDELMRYSQWCKYRQQGYSRDENHDFITTNRIPCFDIIKVKNVKISSCLFRD